VHGDYELVNVMVGFRAQGNFPDQFFQFRVYPLRYQTIMLTEDVGYMPLATTSTYLPTYLSGFLAKISVHPSG